MSSLQHKDARNEWEMQHAGFPLRGSACSSRPPFACRGPLNHAFTLMELLVVIAVLTVLAALLLPAFSNGKAAARRTQCADYLRQLGLAAQMYWHENDNETFRYFEGATNGGRLYWFGWIKPGAEGDRDFDATTGALQPYLEDRSVTLCPSLDYASTIYKFKARGAACSYGYNRYLGQRSLNMAKVARPADILLFADAAQVNDFQAPASPENPLLEEFYYVDADEGAGYPNGHFRHQHQANAIFCDGHVERERPVPGSIDSRLPSQWVGWLRFDCLRLP
jgi:prepilin-type N-terminal cleavage/methylation domain-containing protein/prepilin-type processing-associated H-X9-DG protein